MIIVTNRIKVKPGFGAKMAPAFTKPGPLQEFEGFHKVEVLVASHEDHDEMNVNMYWDNKEVFEAWRSSAAFREAHKRPEPGSEEANKPENGPLLGSEIIISELASSIGTTPTV